jgi:hypothetical protein
MAPPVLSSPLEFRSLSEAMTLDKMKAKPFHSVLSPSLPQPKPWFGIRRAQLSTKATLLSIEGLF